MRHPYDTRYDTLKLYVIYLIKALTWLLVACTRSLVELSPSQKIPSPSNNLNQHSCGLVGGALATRSWSLEGKYSDASRNLTRSPLVIWPPHRKTAGDDEPRLQQACAGRLRDLSKAGSRRRVPWTTVQRSGQTRLAQLNAAMSLEARPSGISDRGRSFFYEEMRMISPD